MTLDDQDTDQPAPAPRKVVDEVDLTPSDATELLDGIAGAFERAHLGLQQARASCTVPLRDL
jgi:hypothetical protein